MSKECTIDLSDYMSNCSISWINFFNRELADKPRDLYGDVSEETINKALEKYHARYDVNPHTGWGRIIFDSPQYRTLFELKYS